MWQQQQYQQMMAARGTLPPRPSSRAQSEFGGASRYQSYCTLPRPDIYVAASNTGVEFPALETLDASDAKVNGLTFSL